MANMLEDISELAAVSLYTVEVLVTVFILVIGVVILGIVVLFIRDVTQRHNTIQRNFPVIGHFRYLFSHLGIFFRQYFFALDREEMPFDRATRDWVKNASVGETTTVAFGSSLDISKPGVHLFANSAFPVLKEDDEVSSIILGEKTDFPYKTTSFFNISGMSYGAISKPAVLALSRGAHLAGCWMNTGEGGLSPYHLEGGGDLVMQIGTAKYGVRDQEGRLSEAKLKEMASHECVRMFELKLSQGAKPGKGGILPKVKVTEEIARIRGIKAHTDSISPNRHPEITNNNELLDTLNKIRELTRKPVGFKAVVSSREWLQDLCECILKRGQACAPDFIVVDSADGGTGAAPMVLMDHMGLSIEESLPLVVDTLEECGLRKRVRVGASGKMVTPSGVAWALCIGADFVNSARGFMISIGCIQALQCNKNTCPTGITTHNQRLQRGLDPTDKSTRVLRYAQNLSNDVRILAHSCGVKDPRKLRRDHCRLVVNNSKSIPYSQLYPQRGPT